MSQSGYEKYHDQADGRHACLIIDQDLVKPPGAEGSLCHTRHPHGRGAGPQNDGQYHHDRILCAAITEVVSLEAARNTVAESVPKGTEETEPQGL